MKNRNKKKFPFLLYGLFGLIIFWLAVGAYLVFNKSPASIYAWPESLKQGGTVFVRVKSYASNISGNFGGEKLFFYKRGNSQDWISFLGVDADQNPGDYKISVNTSDNESLTKEIQVALADFSKAATIPAPSSKKTGITNQKALDNILKNDNPAIKNFLINSSSKPYFSGPFSFPLSSMQTSGISFGKFIGFGKYILQHLGVDLRAPEKTDIYAVNDGKVVATLDLSNYGKTVIIDHGLDIFSMYLHLDQFEVSKGDAVKRGQLIGLSGDTGYVTAPHLHFSMRVDGARVDPVEFIQASQKMNDNFVAADLSQAIINLFNGK